MLCLGVWRERERPGTNHNTIKGKIEQCIKGRIISKVIGWGGGGGGWRAIKKKISLRKKKIAEEIKGMSTQKNNYNNNMQVENSPPSP